MIRVCEHCKKQFDEAQIYEVETALQGTEGRMHDYHTAMLCDKCFAELEKLRVKTDTDFIRGVNK